MARTREAAEEGQGYRSVGGPRAKAPLNSWALFVGLKPYAPTQGQKARFFPREGWSRRFVGCI
jgi:hypothetical protein